MLCLQVVAGALVEGDETEESDGNVLVIDSAAITEVFLLLTDGSTWLHTRGGGRTLTSCSSLCL